jgi:hypothetical protein
MAAGYDRVELPNPAGAGLPRTLTRTEWEALPLDQRIRAILSKKLRFFRGSAEISVREALEGH